MGISREQALDCFRSYDLMGIGMEADAVRRRLHPEGVASYVLDRTIDCAGLDCVGLGDGFEAACDTICGLVGETLDLGGSAVLLRGCGGKGRDIGSLERLFAGIKQRHPSIRLQGLNAPEVVEIADAAGLTLRDAVLRLRDAGLDSIAGDGLDIAAPEAWVEVHRAAHGAGMRTAAAMVFGSGETVEQRVDCLEAARRLQEETGGFAAFVPVSFHQPGGRDLDDTTAVESLKTLAIARMFLDTIENMQWGWAAQGLKLRQMGLRFGSNDVGSVTIGGGAARNGVSANGAATNGASEEDLRRIIRDAGFRPVERDLLYRTMFLN